MVQGHKQQKNSKQKNGQQESIESMVSPDDAKSKSES